MKSIALTALALATSFYINAQTATDKDVKFARCAAQAGVKEVKFGELALKQGNSQEVKTLGQHMIDDHTKAGAELTAIAAKKNIPLPTGLNEENQKEYNMLAAKKGADFDKDYTKCMVKDHKKVIKEFEKESKKGDDSELKSFATSTLPTLEHHKHMSEETCKAVKK